MNKDNSKVNDEELENVTGGVGIGSRGGVCPINGKQCKHGMVSRATGRCLYAAEGVGFRPQEISLDRDGNVVQSGGGEYTYLECRYINDQE